MSYLGEFRLNWTNLLGAGLGLGFGTAFNHYIMNVFGPALIADLGWTKSQFALVGSIGLIGMAFTPVAGRITDRIGPRNAAIVGFTAIPLAYLALSFMSGNIYEFYAILALKFMFGILTATMVFTRVVVERFDRARGIAMACLLSCPPCHRSDFGTDHGRHHRGRRLALCLPGDGGCHSDRRAAGNRADRQIHGCGRHLAPARPQA